MAGDAASPTSRRAVLRHVRRDLGEVPNHSAPQRRSRRGGRPHDGARRRLGRSRACRGAGHQGGDVPGPRLPSALDLGGGGPRGRPAGLRPFRPARRLPRPPGRPAGLPAATDRPHRGAAGRARRRGGAGPGGLQPRRTHRPGQRRRRRRDRHVRHGPGAGAADHHRRRPRPRPAAPARADPGARRVRVPDAGRAALLGGPGRSGRLRTGRLRARCGSGRRARCCTCCRTCCRRRDTRVRDQLHRQGLRRLYGALRCRDERLDDLLPLPGGRHLHRRVEAGLRPAEPHGLLGPAAAVRRLGLHAAVRRRAGFEDHRPRHRGRQRRRRRGGPGPEPRLLPRRGPLLRHGGLLHAAVHRPGARLPHRLDQRAARLGLQLRCLQQQFVRHQGPRRQRGQQRLRHARRRLQRQLERPGGHRGPLDPGGLLVQPPARPPVRFPAGPGELGRLFDRDRPGLPRRPAERRPAVAVLGDVPRRAPELGQLARLQPADRRGGHLPRLRGGDRRAARRLLAGARHRPRRPALPRDPRRERRLGRLRRAPRQRHPHHGRATGRHRGPAGRLLAGAGHRR